MLRRKSYVSRIESTSSGATASPNVEANVNVVNSVGSLRDIETFRQCRVRPVVI